MNEPKEGEEHPTITKGGKLLRMTRLNEIPQLFCVLAGSMSLVGPRPDMVNEYLKCNIPFYAFRSKVLPGITGHAQIAFGYVSSDDCEGARKRLSYDLYYVKNMDFRLYLSVMLRTAEIMVFRRGAN